MSWQLRFYRKVGQGELRSEDVETFFDGEPGCAREEADGASGSRSTFYRFQDAERGADHAFLYAPELVTEEAPDPDFPYEPTPLHFLLPPLQERAVADEALERVERLCGELRLLAADAQREEALPAALERTRLLESYAAYSADVELTIRAASEQRRKYLLIAGILILAYLLISALFGNR